MRVNTYDDDICIKFAILNYVVYRILLYTSTDINEAT